MWDQITAPLSAFNALEARVTALESASPALVGAVALDSFPGTDDERMAAALDYIRAQAYKPALLLSARSHTFASTYPLDIPGLCIVGPGYEREFKNQCLVRVTGDSLFRVVAGVKDTCIRGMSFQGNNANTWLEPVTDLAAGPILTDCTIRECGWTNFRSVMQARVLRVSIERTYVNSGYGTQFDLAGSDCDLWLEGQAFISAHNLTTSDYYIRLRHMSRTRIGPVYITPEVACAMKVEGSYGDLQITGVRFDSTGRTTTAACQGPALIISGGRGVRVQDCWFFNNAVSVGPAQISITGGSDHLIRDCSFGGPAVQASYTPTTRPAVSTGSTNTEVRGLHSVAGGNITIV